MNCRDCDTELDHCHEILVVHADGSFECTGEDECTGWVESHAWILTCAELSPDGCCSAELPLAA